MSLWRDEKYLRLVSSHLDRFKQQHSHTYNFRCPLCGDSEKIRSKARGYIFPKNQTLIFKCHNCSVALPFSALLKRLSKHLYDEYLMESLEEKSQSFKKTEPRIEVAPPSDVPVPSELPSLTLCTSSQHACHAAYTYVVERMLPPSALTRLFATNRARSWLRPLVGLDKIGHDDHPKISDGPVYLVQPFRLPDGTWFGAQLRCLDKKDFLTFRWANEPLKMFGLDAVSSKEVIYVVEGPLDALFLPNAIAPCGSDLLSAVNILEEQLILTSHKRVLVWDNEPRNKEIVRHMRNAIRMHESVVIWPRGYEKDINDMVRAGRTKEDVLRVIKQRTFTGLMAELEFEAWKK